MYHARVAARGPSSHVVRGPWRYVRRSNPYLARLYYSERIRDSRVEIERGWSAGDVAEACRWLDALDFEVEEAQRNAKNHR